MSLDFNGLGTLSFSSRFPAEILLSNGFGKARSEEGLWESDWFSTQVLHELCTVYTLYK